MSAIDTYTLSLHDALPILPTRPMTTAWATRPRSSRPRRRSRSRRGSPRSPPRSRSEEHTSELQSRRDLVFRLLLEKKKELAAELLQISNRDRTHYQSQPQT